MIERSNDCRARNQEPSQSPLYRSADGDFDCASVGLLFAVERIREQSRESFAATIRHRPDRRRAHDPTLALFRFSAGDATKNISWMHRTVHPSRNRMDNPAVFGDRTRLSGARHDARLLRASSLRGDRKLEFVAGGRWQTPHDAVLGRALQALNYELGRDRHCARLGDIAFRRAAISRFGLSESAPTGTPADRTIHISLGVDALHAATDTQAYDHGSRNRRRASTNHMQTTRMRTRRTPNERAHDQRSRQLDRALPLGYAHRQ
jgi:hypothetical protein